MLVCAGASYLAVGICVWSTFTCTVYASSGSLSRRERSALVGCKCWCGGVECEGRGEMCNSN